MDERRRPARVLYLGLDACDPGLDGRAGRGRASARTSVGLLAECGGRGDRGPLRHLRRVHLDDRRHRHWRSGRHRYYNWVQRRRGPLRLPARPARARRSARPFWETLSERGPTHRGPRRAPLRDPRRPSTASSSRSGVATTGTTAPPRSHPSCATSWTRSPAAITPTAAWPAPRGDDQFAPCDYTRASRRPSHARRGAPAPRPDPRRGRGQAARLAAPPRAGRLGPLPRRSWASRTASATSSGTSTTSTTRATTRPRAGSSAIRWWRCTSASTPSSASTWHAAGPDTTCYVHLSHGMQRALRRRPPARRGAPRASTTTTAARVTTGWRTRAARWACDALPAIRGEAPPAARRRGPPPAHRRPRHRRSRSRHRTSRRPALVPGPQQHRRGRGAVQRHRAGAEPGSCAEDVELDARRGWSSSAACSS